MIIEQLRSMNDVYNDINANKKYLPGHYHNYIGADKIFPLPNNDGTIKAFYPNDDDVQSFPDTKLRQLYTDEERATMHKDIERKNNLSKPIYRFKANKINLSRFNTRYNDDSINTNDDDTNAINNTNAINDTNATYATNDTNNGNMKKSRSKKIRYYDRDKRKEIIENTSSTMPDIITSKVDSNTESDIIMRWNYLNKGTTTTTTTTTIIITTTTNTTTTTTAAAAAATTTTTTTNTNTITITNR